jgi:hypothetical protein
MFPWKDFFDETDQENWKTQKEESDRSGKFTKTNSINN